MKGFFELAAFWSYSLQENGGYSHVDDIAMNTAGKGLSDPLEHYISNVYDVAQNEQGLGTCRSNVFGGLVPTLLTPAKYVMGIFCWAPSFLNS